MAFKITKVQYVLSAVLCAQLGTSACSHDDNSGNSIPQPANIESSEIKNLTVLPANLSITVGASVSLLAQTITDNSEEKDVTASVVWSMDPASQIFEQSQTSPSIFKATEAGESFIYAVSTNGVIAKSKVTVFEIEPDVSLGNPIGLMATSNSTSSIELTWTAGSGITNHQIAYLPGSSAPSSCDEGLIITQALIGAPTIYEIADLSIGTQYAFRVCSTNANGVLSSGVTISHTTLDEVVLPNPTGLSVTDASTSTIELSWTAGSGITEHKIAYLPGYIAPETCNDGLGVSPTLIGLSSTYEVDGLSTNSVYTFRVCSFDGDSILSSGTVVSSATDDVPVVVVVNPTGLLGDSLSPTSIDLSWTAAPGVTQHQISYLPGYFSPSSCSEGIIISSSLVGLPASYVLEDLNSNSQYSFRVCSLENGVLSSGVTVSVATDPEPVIVLGNPTGLLAASALVDTINLSWTAAIGMTMHQIAYLPGTLAPATCSEGIIISPTLIGLAVSYPVNGLATSSQYSFRVCSTDVEGNLSTGATVTLYTAANHRLFVTAGGWTGLTIGGLAGADEKCNLEAALYGLTGSTWKAIVSGSGVGESAQARISITRPIFNTRPIVSGGPQLIAINALDFWDTTLANAPRFQADGVIAVVTSAFTGSNADGTYSGANCANWTSAAGSGGRGLNTSVTSTWITNATALCNTVNRLYCIDGQ